MASEENGWFISGAMLNKESPLQLATRKDEVELAKGQ
jgi:hypothetical protein